MISLNWLFFLYYYQLSKNRIENIFVYLTLYTCDVFRSYSTHYMHILYKMKTCCVTTSLCFRRRFYNRVTADFSRFLFADGLMRNLMLRWYYVKKEKRKRFNILCTYIIIYIRITTNKAAETEFHPKFTCSRISNSISYV